jgi:anti-anti-sigma factor
MHAREASLEITQVAGLVVARLSGRYDTSALPALRRRLSRVDPSRVQLVVDLSEVSFFDSSLLSVLVGLHHQARGRRVIAVVAPEAQQRRVFALGGLEGAFLLLDDLDAFGLFTGGADARPSPLGRHGSGAHEITRGLAGGRTQ